MANSEEFRELVARIVAGNTGEFREIVEKHQKLVAHIVFRMVTSEADREDICQEVFVKVYRNLASFKFDCKLSTWIATIAYNTSLNFLDKKKLPLYDDLAFEDGSLEDKPVDIDMPDAECEAKDISAILRREIDMLPAQYRTILALYHLDEMSYREIAQITRLSDGTVKSHLFRARKLLRERLTAKYRQEDLCR